MGWETRHGGRRYLYRNRRVAGRPVKEYLAAEGDRFGFDAVMEYDLDRVLRREAKVRRLERAARRAYRERIDGLLAAAASANADLRERAEGLLYTAGYHRHHRGEWRMMRELKQLGATIEQLKGRLAGPTPVLDYKPPAGDAAAAELFAKARAGDAAAVDEVRAMIKARGWVNWIGDLGKQATLQLIDRAAGGDPVWKAGLGEKADALRRDLLADGDSVLEKLLARRVVNGWVAVHALELELAVRPPADRRVRDYLDKAVTRAQGRYVSAVRELARVRRLQAPQLIARLNPAVREAILTAGPAEPAAAVPDGVRGREAVALEADRPA